jgi:hypothetical protein
LISVLLTCLLAGWSRLHLGERKSRQELMMIWVRRILSVCMTLAFAGFSVATAAAVHSHAPGEDHGSLVHVVALGDDHHAYHGVAADDAQQVDASVPADVDQGAESESVPVFHVHACVHYAPVDDRVRLGRSLIVAVAAWSQPHYAAVTHAAAPPLRPPRNLL